MTKKTEQKAEVKEPENNSAWVVNRKLRREQHGDDVHRLQEALIASGYACGRSGANGIFGKDTEIAVRAFQGSKGLTVNGIAGKSTVTALGGAWKE